MSDGYEADYFVPTVRRVLDPRMAEHAFGYAGTFEEVSAYWTSGNVFLNVSYMPETIPRYEILAGLGLSEVSPVRPRLYYDSVGVWRLLPETVLPKAGDWCFDSPEALERALLRIWTDAIVPYALPVSRDHDRLEEAIRKQNEEADREMEEIQDGRLLKYAREAFDAGRFSDVVAAYDELGEDKMKRSDLMRLDIARRRR